MGGGTAPGNPFPGLGGVNMPVAPGWSDFVLTLQNAIRAANQPTPVKPKAPVATNPLASAVGAGAGRGREGK